MKHGKAVKSKPFKPFISGQDACLEENKKMKMKERKIGTKTGNNN